MAFEMSFQKGMNAAAGIEVNIVGDGQYHVRVMELALRKKLIHITSKKEAFITLDQIASLSLKAPLAVNFTGKGILIKKTSTIENITEQNLRQLFPGFKAAEFYVQHFRSAGNSFVAFIRKEIASQVLNAFAKQGAQVLLFSIGPFVVDQVIPLLNNYGEKLDFDGHQILLEHKNKDKHSYQEDSKSQDDQKYQEKEGIQERGWLDYQYTAGAGSEFDLKIDIEPLAPQFLLAYAAAFQLLLHERLELIQVGDPEINQKLVEYTAKIAFNRKSTLLLLSFFTLLLLNFLIFSYYNSANQQLAGKAGQRSEQFSDQQRITTDLQQMEAQVINLGWNKGQAYAFICDQIGKTVPGKITLKELTINRPKENTSLSLTQTLSKTGTASEKDAESGTGIIQVTGQSDGVYSIKDWIFALKQLSWVKSVRLEKYIADEQSGAQAFTLLLNY